MSAQNDGAIEQACAVIRELEDELAASFGYGELALQLELVAPLTLAVSGNVLSRRLGERLERRLRRRLPDFAFRLELGAQTTGDYRRLTAPVWVYRQAPWVEAPRELTTLLLPEDEAVEVLRVERGECLVRSVDCTLGWVPFEVLGAKTEAPRLRDAALDGEALLRQLESFIGVRYLRGGTDENGIDCSGLVQRCFFRASGARLPRHSTDQLAFAATSESGGLVTAATGSLLFAWTGRDGPCHVGVAGAPGAVVHASVSRARVLEEPRERFAHSATRTEVVAPEAVLAAYRRFAGHACIELPAR